MLKVDDLIVRYGKAQALHGVSLSVDEGEMVALLGRNGAGKSTFLLAVSGLVPVAGGTVTFNGSEIQGVPPHQIVHAGISHVPQDRELFGSLTVLENLELGAADNPARTVLRERMDRVFEEFPRLAERRGQRAGTLSGGEQQMVAIARALMAEPKLLLLDEPSTGLAPIMVDQVAEVILALRRTGLSVLLVEQNTHLGLELADRAVILESGHVSARGTSDELAADDSVRRAYMGV
ncbi:ABC transporter ATP-binding protein [Baekduia soli]|uniref:ABC transporter ATP-binding protein n=1 Tax=Baekduia soli TaxID=496014 RepID=A0A5B8U3C7_9ACTN|nr:ABC transporter ATP-binding protein [Baekduia soli]QEC47431.1 ABC transporter ATP-binding protein [Baekduia soli]